MQKPACFRPTFSLPLQQAFLSSLDEEGKLLWSRAFLDGGFLPAKKEETGLTEVGKGTKRMLVVDGNGIPLMLSISRAGLR